jgi:ABC-type nitrate/sulfonate/bicarbonate transport system substrate-binding protein
MTESVKFTIGGVPEHFNLPWHLAIKEGSFEKEGISLTWRDYPGGTGAMTKDLRNGTLDIAVLLTEGMVADIAKGNTAKIISLFVKSPLIWGIHVPAGSAFSDVKQIEGKRYAISRIGSGSHLMAFVDAQQRGWQLREDQLVVVGGLDGAREAFENNKADIFMWERFMTQPLVDQGEFRRIGECLTPWPCFVIAVRKEVLDQFRVLLQKLLQVVYQATKRFKNNPKAAEMVCANFGLTPKDAHDWISLTEWAVDNSFPSGTLDKVVQTLHELHLIEKPVEVAVLYENLGSA